MSEVFTYFDSLPDDDLSKVVKHMDPHPELHFQMFVPHSPLKRAAPLIFNRLDVSIPGKLRCDIASGTLHVGAFADLDRLSIKAFRACGKDNFTSLNIAINNRQNVIRPLVGSLGSHIAAHCKTGMQVVVTAKILSQHSNWEQDLVKEILRHLSSRAVSISYMHGFPSRPHDLVKRLSKWPLLRSLSVKVHNLIPLQPLWSAVGDTLEHIKVKSNSTTGWLSCIELLRIYCGRLNSIHLHNPLEHNAISEEKLANFLTSYGNQLISAQLCLSQFTPAACSRIVSNCPRLRCTVCSARNGFDNIAALRDKVEEIKLCLDSKEDWLSLSVAMWKCYNLVKLKIMRHPSDNTTGISEDCMKNIFNSRLSWLETLQIKLVMLPYSLMHITSCTSRLKSIHLCFLSFEQLNLEALVESNPLLQDARIDEKTISFRSAGKAMEIGSKLVAALVKPRNMVAIKLLFPTTHRRPNLSMFRKLCSPYRIRTHLSIRVSFGGIEYGNGVRIDGLASH